MPRYPIGQQDFQKLREGNFLYVDKTRFIFELVQNSYIFLARPRRFGKSLLLSTIKAYFEGKKELFMGLEIEKLEKDWKKHPVFFIALARINNFSTESLESFLNQQFTLWENNLDIKNNNPDFGSRFSTILIESFRQTGQRAVVLVDEYDNPMVNTLEGSDDHEKNRSILKSVYSNLKDLDGYIRFGMLTGVSRFSKMTIFSGLNNLSDISFLNRYSAICGITQDEIKRFLRTGVEELAKEDGKSFEDTLDDLAKWYDGYHFSEKCPDLYNPFSLLNALANSGIKNYWFETATPTFLVNKLRNSKSSFVRIFNSKADESSLAETDTLFQSPVALLYQTGYLTIKSYDKSTDKYTLGIPNLEVEKSLFPFLLSRFIGTEKNTSEELVDYLKTAIINGDADTFLKSLKMYLAGVPTFPAEEKLNERYFEHTLYLIFRSMGFDVTSQAATSFSRSDLVIHTNDYIYIFELKNKGKAKNALLQIEDKEYSLPSEYGSKKIIKIGLVFSSKKRNITSWKIET